MSKSAALLALMASTVVMAGSLPVSSPLANEKGFSTLTDAAVAGLASAVHASSQTEEAGAIYKQGEKFYYTSPASNLSDDSFAISISFPKSSKLVGIYHTHPASYPNNYLFSPNDINVANRLHVISYVAVLYNSVSYKVIKYIPNVTKTIGMSMISDNINDIYTRISYGEDVIKVIPLTARVCNMPEWTLHKPCQ